MWTEAITSRWMASPRRSCAARRRTHQLLSWGLLALASAEFAVLAANWLAYCPPTAAVGFALSGAWFRQGLQTEQAGLALDQPTVGKFFLWSSVLSCLACTIVLLLRVVVPVDRRVARRWVSAAATVILVLVLIELLAPTFLLVQYIASLGITVRRVLALCLTLGFWTLLPSAIARLWTARQTTESNVERTLSWVLACSLVAPTYYVNGMLRPCTWRHWSATSAAFLTAWAVLLVQGLCAMRLTISYRPSQANVSRRNSPP